MSSLPRMKPDAGFAKSHHISVSIFHWGLKGISEVIKRVKDTAVLPCDYNISADDLTRVRIYWQKKKNSDVVLSVVSGEANVWPKYKNRTIPTITNNPSIVILALQLSDSGIYDCIIQKLEKGGFQRVHLKSVRLQVTADFPVPSISELENPSANIKRIICSTSGGFPKPHLSWLENGKELNAISTTVSQDPESKLYTISSELDFNVTNNHSFMCLVKYANLTVSQIFDWQKYEPTVTPFIHQSRTWITPLAFGFAVLCPVLCVALCVVILKCRPNSRCAARTCCERRNEESTEMETISPIYSRPAKASE